MSASPEAIVRALPVAAAVLKLRAAQGRPLSLVPKFRGAAQEVQATTSHEWMLAGPAETGKTYGGLWKLDSAMRRYPKSRGALIRKVNADMKSTVLETWERIIAIRGSVEKFGGTMPELYTYPNGSVLHVGGMDRAEKVLSGERDFVYVNQAEELTVNDWELISTRCTGRGSAHPDKVWLGGDCNPGPPKHWILTRGNLKVMHSHHEDNPTLYDEAGKITEQGLRTLAALDSLTGIRLKRLRLGEWAGAEGAVYDNFDAGTHIIDAFPIPADWRRMRSIDFGYKNPFVCQWWALDPDGRAFLYREIYKTQTLVEDHAREIKRLTGDERIEVTVADHDAEDRATLARYGVSTLAAWKGVSDGIQAVQTRLAKAGDGRSRLFVMKGACVQRDKDLSLARKPTSTGDEFEYYVWPKNASGKPEKEEPVKEFDHGMDAMRYFVAHVDAIGDSPNRAWREMLRKQKEVAA